jgi:hypothetical protein
VANSRFEKKIRRNLHNHSITRFEKKTEAIKPNINLAGQNRESKVKHCFCPIIDWTTFLPEKQKKDEIGVPENTHICVELPDEAREVIMLKILR